MDIPSAILIVLGLALFESITSIDNAIINAEVLQGMQARAATVVSHLGNSHRGLRRPRASALAHRLGHDAGPGALGCLHGEPHRRPGCPQGHPGELSVLLMGGGVFFVFLFFHWIFLEPKKYGLPVERIFARQGAWFYAVVSIALTIIVWFALDDSPMLAFGAVVGSSAFFITHGFKRYAEEQEARLLSGEAHMSDIGKILYLEVIDLTFSIDGVVGAFAFTLSVPLILLGNGIGAVVVRQLTVYGVDRIKKYVYLKNGAMYSVFVLGCVMLAHGFGYHVPEWLTPVATFFIVGYFFFKSRWQAKKIQA